MSGDYNALKAATQCEDNVTAQTYADRISREVDRFALRTGSRLSGYDMQAIAGRGGFTPVEKVSYIFMDSKKKSHIQAQLSGFRDALMRHAEKFLPEWYERFSI